MPRIASFFFATLLFTNILEAQTPQFAVVGINGVTKIRSTLDSAYDISVDGDHIYLPGGSYNFSNPVNKRLFIYGAGCNPDSSNVTKPTVLTVLRIRSGASDGLITGCYINSIIDIEDNITNYSIKYCYITNGIRCDSGSSNCIISNNIIGAFNQGCYYSIRLNGQNNLITNNLLFGIVQSFGGNAYRNNIFTYCQGFCSTSLSCSNELFENNIFACAGSGASNSIFNNNIGRSNGIDGSNNQGTNNYIISTPIDSLFIAYLSQTSWNFVYNVHLRPGSSFLTAGTDGGELGIYGGIYKTNEGWVPSNPHIYFKQVAEQTNNNGQLQIKFKVRTND